MKLKRAVFLFLMVFIFNTGNVLAIPLVKRVDTEWKKYRNGWKTKKQIDNVDDVENIENNTGANVNDIHVKYSNDGRCDVHWVSAEGGSDTAGWNGNITVEKNFCTDSRIINLVGPDIADGGSVNVKFKGKLNKLNYIKKTYEWSNDGVLPPVVKPGGVNKGGAKKDVGGRINIRQNGLLKNLLLRLLFIDNPSLIDILIKNLKWIISSTPVAPASLYSPATWAAVSINPDILIKANDYSAPVLIYGIDPALTETILATWDRYTTAGVYIDTVYIKMVPDGLGEWIYTVAMDITNQTGSTETGMTYSIFGFENVFSSTITGSPDFSSSAVLNGPDTIDATYFSGSIADAGQATVWVAGNMEENKDLLIRDIKWAGGSTAADDWAFMLSATVPDIIFDVYFTFTNYYDVPVKLSGFESTVTNGFLDVNQVGSWATGWSSLGSDIVVAANDSVQFTIFNMRDWMSLSTGGSVQSADGTLNFENFNFSHREYQPFYTKATAVTISSFTIEKQNSQVILNWKTASEVDNEGFNILRSENADSGFVQINENLIMANNSLTGAAYQFIDDSIAPDKDYFYKLEDIDKDGTSTMHGPVGTAVQNAQSEDKSGGCGFVKPSNGASPPTSGDLAGTLVPLIALLIWVFWKKSEKKEKTI